MKTIEDLQRSRDSRAQIISKFGEIPESILKYDKSIKATDLMADHRNYASKANNGGHKGKLAIVFDVSGQSCRGEDGALSRFPQNIGRKLLLLYTNRGDTVVDPFAGHNSRMELCYRAQRNYIGCDISKTFMEANFKLRTMLLNQTTDSLFPEQNTSTIELHNVDSRQMPINNNAGDFTLTSPPYWCLEHYGDEIGQLGKNDYPEFLRQLARVVCENFRCLKSGSFSVWCVNDFRWNGKFYAYHMHMAQLLRDAGFKWHDIAITDLGTSIRAAFASQVIKTKILPKRHEYCLVFRKP